MRRDIIVVDNFYEDPDAVVAYAKSLLYYSPYAHNHKGSSTPEDMRHARWITSRFKKASECPFKSSEAFIARLEKIIGEEVDREHWNKDFPENADGSVVTPRPDLIDPSLPPKFENLKPNAVSCRWNCSFTFKFFDHPKGTGVHNHMQDTWNAVGADGWTGLIYFNKSAPPGSGLRLWRNKHGNDLEWMSTADRWELIDEFSHVYNRLILVRGRTPHSGGSGFGSGMEDGRLFQSLFFKTKRVYEIDNSSLPLKSSL